MSADQQSFDITSGIVPAVSIQNAYMSAPSGAAGYLAAADPRPYVAANSEAVAVVVAALVVAVGVLIAIVVHRGARHSGRLEAARRAGRAHFAAGGGVPKPKCNPNNFAEKWACLEPGTGGGAESFAQHPGKGGRSCKSWSPAAVAEAQALATVGSYQDEVGPAEGAFQHVINETLD